MTKSIIQVMAGAAFGVVAVLSCSESPKHADATTCDCPASEAPIAGRIVFVESAPQTIPAMDHSGASVACTAGMQFLSGSCRVADPQTLEDVTVQQFGFDKTTSSWVCVFKNNKSVPVDVKASVMCLKPAP